MRTLVLVLALATTAACASPVDREDGVAATESFSGDAAQVVRPQRAAELALPVTTLERRSAVASGGTPIPRISIESNMVIRTGQTSIEVDSLERAVA